MNVLIVDDHQVVWSGMRLVMERLAGQIDPGRKVGFVGARDIPDALRHRGTEFDLVLLDYHLPGVSGLDALREVRNAFEGSPVVVLSGEQSPRLIRATIENGAAGFIPKAMNEREMHAALAQVLSRGVYLPPIAVLDSAVVESAGIDAAAADDPMAADQLAAFLRTELSPRPRQVLSRAIQGKPNKIIARELGIAEGTVKVHLAMVYRALGVHNRTEAMYKLMAVNAADVLDRLE